MYKNDGIFIKSILDIYILWENDWILALILQKNISAQPLIFKIRW